MELFLFYILKQGSWIHVEKIVLSNSKKVNPFDDTMMSQIISNITVTTNTL